MASYVTKSITAQNTFSDWLAPKEQTIPGADPYGTLDYSCSFGTSAEATVTIQKTYTTDDDSTTYDCFAFTQASDAEDQCGVLKTASINAKFRIGVKPGDYTQGTITARLDK